MKFQWKQYLCALTAAFIWGTSFVVQDLCSDRIPPFTFNAVRAAIGAVTLAIFLLIRTAAEKTKPTRKKRDWKSLLTGGILSGVFLFAASYLQQSGIGDSGGGKAAFITTLYIVIVPLVGILFRRKTAPSVLIAVPVAAVGLYFLSIKENFTVATGDLLLMGCALMFAAQILVIDRFSEKTDGVEFSLVQFLTAAVLSGIGSLFESPSAEAILSCAVPLLYAGIFVSGVAYTLQIFSQKDTNPTVVSMIFSLESVFGMGATSLILRQFPSTRELAGCVLLLCAVVLAQLPIPVRKKTKKNT